MRLLVTGAGGLLGRAFARGATTRGHAVVARAHAELDIADEAALRRAVAEARPDAVLNCAAQARLEACDAQPELARRVNRDGARNVAVAAADGGARCVHFSTDYVFDGTAPAAYGPDAPRSPLSVYGRTKAEGEDAVLDAEPDALVVRVSWLYAADRGFVRWVVGAAERGEPLPLVRDQVSRPSWVDNVVANVLALLEGGAPGGFWHLADGGETTRLVLAQEALRLTGLDAEIRPVDRETLWPGVPRPARSVLDVSASETFLGRDMEPWSDALARCLGAVGT